MNAIPQPMILIIDDDVFAMTMTYQVVIKAVKFSRVKTIFSAREALSFLQILHNSKYQKRVARGLILVDLHMPAMNGFEFLDAFEKFDEPIQRNWDVCVLSSTGDEREVDMLYEKKCFAGLCSKPLTTRKLEMLAEEKRFML